MKMSGEERVGGAGIGRRDFLKHAAMLGAGLAAGAAGRGAGAAPAAESKLERRNEKPDIVYVRLGRTNLAVSALVFGCIKLVPDNLHIVDAAVNRGINLVHVCASYMSGQSIKTLGGWFKKPGNRDRVFLAFKPRVDKEDPPTQLVGIDEDLKTLNTDHVDLFMMPIHSPDPVLNDDLFKQIEDVKKAGKARFIGLTFHKNLKGVFENGLKANRFDVFLPTYSNGTRDELKPLLPEAKKKDIGLLTMKSTRGMKKGDDPVPAWRAFLADGIDAVLRTQTTQPELDQAIRLALKGDKTPAQAMLRTNCSGECTLCGACQACPRAVAIQDTLRTYQYYVRQQGWVETARAQYAAIPPESRAPACGDCGRCELVCPRNLPVRQLVREAHEALA
jgi:hypothetical protein